MATVNADDQLPGAAAGPGAPRADAEDAVPAGRDGPGLQAEPGSPAEPGGPHEPDPTVDDVVWAEPVRPSGPGGVSSVRTQNRVALVATLVVVIALVAGGAFLLGRGTSGAGTAVPGETSIAGGTVEPSVPAATAGASADPIDNLPSDGNRLGSPDARVVVEYWADYQCPYCAAFAQQRLPDLFPLIADGTVAVEHRDFAFLGPESIDAAIAVRCAGGEGRYWPMHDAVYAAQDGENRGAFSRERLVAIGESVGIDASTLQACFDDHALLVDVLDDTAAAARAGVQSTPTVDVNGTRFTGVPQPGEMEAAIDEALAGATPAPPPTQAPIQDPWAGVATEGRVAGDASAPVTVDLWLDYASADGVALARDLAPELRSRVNAGTARVVLHDLALLGDESVVAAGMVRCTEAQGGPTFLVSDVLSSAAQAGAGVFTPLNLLRFGAQLGLDVRALDACLNDPGTAQAVRDETAAGQALGLEAAPTVIVSRDDREVGRFSGPLDLAQVLAAIDGSG